MYQAKSGVKNFSLYCGGGVPRQKFFPSLNMYQAKSDVKIFSLYWGGGSLKIFFFQSEHVSSQIWCQNFFPFTETGTPPQTWDQVTPPDLRLGTPQTWTWDPPYLDLDLGPPLPGPGPGTPPTQTWTLDPPYLDLRPGTPLEVWTDTQSENITFPILRMRAVKTTRNIVKPIFIVRVLAKIFIYVVFLYLIQFWIHLKYKFLSSLQNSRTFISASVAQLCEAIEYVKIRIFVSFDEIDQPAQNRFPYHFFWFSRRKADIKIFSWNSVKSEIVVGTFGRSTRRTFFCSIFSSLYACVCWCVRVLTSSESLVISLSPSSMVWTKESRLSVIDCLVLAVSVSTVCGIFSKSALPCKNLR